jgi:hypothetical protein
MHLKYEPNLPTANPGQLIVIELRQISAVQEDVPARRVIQSADDIQQRALAAAGPVRSST